MTSEQRHAYHAVLIAAILASLLWERHHLAIKGCVSRFLYPSSAMPQAPLASVQMPRQWQTSAAPCPPPAAAQNYTGRVIGGGF